MLIFLFVCIIFFYFVLPRDGEIAVCIWNCKWCHKSSPLLPLIKKLLIFY